MAIEEKGKGKNNELSFSLEVDSVSHAKSIFFEARERLLHPDQWHALAGWASASFELMNRAGHKCDQPAHVHDYLRIRIPGPRSSAGDGYDWVMIEQLNDQHDMGTGIESIEMKLRPSANPADNTSRVAHFFKDSSTSTFLITRNGTKLSSFYFGRQEQINNRDADLKDKVRNTVIGLAAFAGVSEMQWHALIKGFLTSKRTVK